MPGLRGCLMQLLVVALSVALVAGRAARVGGSHRVAAEDQAPARDRSLQAETASLPSAVNFVYFDGLSHGWRSVSYGCLDCNFTDIVRKYNNSVASAYTNVSAWGAIVLETDSAFSSAAVLDLYLKGPGIQKVSFYLEDTSSRRYSRLLSFANPGTVLVNNGPLTVLGSDNDGWIRLQINLQSLTADITSAASVVGGTKTGTGTWNRLVFKDISGTGFQLQFAYTAMISTDSGFNIASSEQWSTIPGFFPLPSLGIPSFPPTAFGNLPSSFLPTSNSPPPPRSASPLPAAQPTDRTTTSQPSPSPARVLASPPPQSSPGPSLSLPAQSSIPPSTSTSTSPPTPAPTSAQPGAPMLPVFNLDMLNGIVSPTKFIMKLRPNATFGNIRSICQELGNIALPPGFTAPRFTGSCDPLFNALFNITIPNNVVPDWLFQSFSVNSLVDLNAMRSSLGSIVEYFERDLVAATTQNFMATIETTNTNYWNLDRLDQTSLPLDGQYNPGNLDGTGSHIYVLDTGVRWSHIDFSGRVGTSTSVISSSYWDDHGHGSHVAGTAMGSVHGVAKGATLHAVKVLDSSGSGSYSNIISGLGWVKNHVQSNGIRQAVVSLSLGGPRAASLNDAVEDLILNGIMVVVAAGNNNGGDACSYSPSSSPNAITIGASTNSDSLASFSNIGGCLFMFAPGTSITSASNAGDNAETIMSGTSMATPHVAGIVAMILQMSPGAGVSAVKTALDRAAPRITFDSSSPSRLSNAQSTRLRGASPPPPAVVPVTSPQTSSPTPSTQAPSSTSAFSPIQFPSFSSPSKPSWCSTCAWCMFCT